MTVYAITFAASAKREFLDLPLEVIERIRPKIHDLTKDPRPPGCKKLQGYNAFLSCEFKAVGLLSGVFRSLTFPLRSGPAGEQI